ncbi:MAG: hypothetical protein ACI9JZ_002270, partial [Lentimonas sp.]
MSKRMIKNESVLTLPTLFLHLPKGHPVQSPLQGQLGRPLWPPSRYCASS